MQTTRRDEELVGMEEEIMLHDSIPLSPNRPLSFEHITLDDVSIVGLDSANQASNFADSNAIYSPERYFTVAETAARSLTHLTLNELGKRLLIASRTGNSEDVKLLMAKGAPFTCDWLGTSALHLAAQNDNQETVEILLRAGISRDSRTKVDKTALHLASAEGNAVIVEMLLAHGSDVNACDMLRMTPLHWAVDREHKDVIKVLLEHGANPNIISKFDKTVFSIALDNKRPDLLAFIQSIKPLPSARSVQDAARERDAATLAATHSITNELAQVPAVSQQEEVETSATDSGKVFESDYFEDTTPEEAIKSSPSSASNIDLASIEGDFAPSTNTMKYLQAHGITMLPVEEARPTLTEVAMESGGKVVLTEAGKLAMNLTEENASNNITKPRRIVIRKQIVLANSSPKGPNILKRTDEIVQKVAPGENNLVAKLTEANLKLDAANRKASEAERIAKEAVKQMKEARQQAKHFKEENEHFRIMIKSMKRKHPGSD